MKQDAWIVEPHIDPQYSHAVFWVSDDPDGRQAMEFAQRVIEMLWDQSDCLAELDVRVSLKRGAEYPEDVDDGL